MLKKISLFIIALLALLLIIAALLPSKFRVERSIIINATPEKVFWQVADLKNYLLWNPWSELDPKLQNTLSEKTKGEGATWAWKGKKVGTGKLTILKTDEFKYIETKVEFVKPWKTTNYGFWNFTPRGGQTFVSWAFEGEFSYPFERFMYFFMDNMLGEDFDKGLANLKKRCEIEGI